MLAPGSYKFYLEHSKTGNRLTRVSLSSSNLDKSVEYWSRILKMKSLKSDDKQLLLSYGDNQVPVKAIHFTLIIRRDIDRLQINCTPVPTITFVTRQFFLNIYASLVNFEVYLKVPVSWIRW